MTVPFYTHLPASEDGTEYSETSAYKFQTPGNHQNSLTLDLKKTNFVQFFAKHTQKTLTSIDYEDNHILNTNSTSFLGFILDDGLSWKPHINQLCSKLRSACYILRTLTPFLTQQNMKIIYFSYFHSVEKEWK